MIKGTVLSGFGTAQANGEIWQNDEECQRLQYRIRDLLVVIAVEAMCLAQILSPEANDEADTFGATLLHSRDRLHAVHSFIMEQTEDLAPGHPEAETVFPHYPTPILCLAWAVVLRSLPPHLQPPSGEDFQLDTTHMSGDDPVVYLGAATRALRLSSGLFPWFESILQGPLFEATKDAFSGDLAVDMASLRRSPIKDLLIGLSELIHIQSIADHPGLYSTWVLLFGGGVQEASTSLANNYWAVDYAYDDRRAILDHSLWPREPTYLPRILAALTGVSSDDEVNLALTQVSPVPDVFDYVNELPFITITSPHSTFTIAGEDDSGRTIVEATVDFELPGGAIIPRRARGTILSEEDAHPAVVSWRFRQAGWSLLIEILRGAVGLPASPRINNDARRLELVDLGVQSDDLSPILSSGLKLLRSVLRSSEVASLLVRNGSPGDRFPGQSLLELALAVLTDRSRPERSQVDFVAAKHAIDILQSLLLTGNEAIWQAFRASGFFDSHSRRQGSVASLIQSDGLRGKHGLTAALLRLVRSLASANAGDAQVVRSAVKLVVTEVWSQFSGWRYQDISKRYEIASLLIEIFDIVLRHPLGADGKSPSPAAAYLFDVFVNNTSPLSYRPIVDVFTQSSQLATRFVQARRWSDAEIVYAAFDHATSLLSTLLRLAPTLKVSVNALPFSLFASTIVTTSGDKIQLVDHLFDLIFQPSLQPTGLKLLLRLLRVYLATSSSGSQRPSLAGMLRNPNTLNKIATVAVNTGLDDVKPDAWALLGTIIATQPGCAAILIPSQRDGKLAGLLKHAVDEVQDWKLLFAEAPSGLAAVLGCVQSVLESASASNAVSALRSQASFWQAVHDIAVKFVALPSSFSDNIAADVHKYSYAVQAKANATSLLAAELALTLDADDETETKTQALVVSLLRNTGALEDTALAAVHTSCDPAVHANEAATIKANGVNLAPLRTINLPEERQYGIQYLYDGVPVIFNDSERQVSLNRSIAILNLNWSQLDADVNYTKAWRLLLDIASTLTSGDALVSRAAVRAANAIAGVLADEDRGGDVMLAIQTERLSILATLLDIALDPETEITEPAVVKELANSVRRIVESTLFPPIISLRHSELPPIHRPVLRVLLLLSQAQAGSAADEVREVLFDSGATFALDAANIVLDTILLQTNLDAEKDLSLIVALLCEMSRVSTSTAVWLDKLMQVNLIPRSLDVIVRTRPVDDTLPPHFHTILLLHLAIASNGPTAEKLAVSGVLPAYADNVVAVAAEAGRIDVTNANDSFHRAWCELLQVVTALLSSLPDAASFARSDAVPFVRVVLPQLLHGLQYTGAEQPLSAPALEEMELVADVFYGLSNAVKPGPYSLLLEFAPSAMVFLRSAQHAVSHPHIFSSYIIPSSEEEQAALEKERTFVGDNQDISAADHKAWPTVASRMDALMRVTRTILVALVRFTHAWASLGGDREPHAQFLLPYDVSGLHPSLY